MIPTPEELIEARRVIRRLSHAIPFDEVRDLGGTRMWDSLVEGGRAIAVTTAYLGQMVDPAYSEAWEKMISGEYDD